MFPTREDPEHSGRRTTSPARSFRAFAFLVPVFALVLGILGIALTGFAQAPGGADVDARKAALEADLAALEKQIESQRELLSAKQREGVSLERDVAILNAQIEKAKLEIRARNIVVDRLGGEINTRGIKIDGLNAKIDRERQSLAQLIRKTRQLESASLIEIVLANKDLSDFLVDLDSFEFIQAAMQESFVELRDTRAATEEEKRTLEEKRLDEVELRTIQELEKKKIEQRETERKRLLKITKGQEMLYQQVLKNQEKTAAQIRAELFTLRGSAAIPFGTALDYANAVSKQTGVRPAFILGVIAEESNLGANVGTGNWRVDMHNPRDTVPFQQITARLGLDPDKMPVSKKPWYGWGGAMGPAQFIPSTWIIYEEEIGKLTGHNPPNPWDPVDAFMAAGILLRDGGAAQGTPAAERRAALCYFAGCRNANKASYAFYGDEVMELAAKYQRQIDILQGR